MSSEREMRSAGAAAVKRLDFLLFLLLFVYWVRHDWSLLHVMLEKGASAVAGSHLIDISHRSFVQNPYLGASYVSRI